MRAQDLLDRVQKALQLDAEQHEQRHQQEEHDRILDRLTPREHEVVECFIAGPEDRYLEVELGPHGHHLVLRLNGIRQIEERELPLEYEVVRAGDRWSGRALIPFHWLPERPWRVNAYSIHGQGASRRYLAAMPGHGDTPDFHQLDSFMWLPPS